MTLHQSTRNGAAISAVIRCGRIVSRSSMAQRVSAALSVPTAEGPLYDVDTRLRPQGAQGPLAVSVESFARYQRESAWTWEHMALARARVVAGSYAARADVDDIIREVLCAPRDAATLRDDVLRMRGEMAQLEPKSGAQRGTPRPTMI